VSALHEPGRRPQVIACDFRPWSDGDSPEKVLARLASDYRLKHARCTTTLEEHDYKLLLTEAPDVPTGELKAAVRWRVKDLIDFHINDATIDVFDLPGDNTRGKARSMYAVVARNGAIQKRADQMNAAGINLDIIDIPELAHRNLAALLPEDAAGVVFLSLFANSGLITLTKQGEIYFSRSVDVGLNTLQQDVDLTGYFDRIVLEVQRSLDYYDGHFRQAPIANLVLAPLGVDVSGLLDYLNANLNAKAAMMDLEQLLEFDGGIQSTLETKCLTTLGAALRQEQKSL
jgi:MSHA biogenesis protein MshI